MKTLCSVVCLILFSLLAQTAQATTPEREPTRLDDVRVSPQSKTSAVMELPYQFATWKLVHRATQDKDDKRDDLCLVGARPTLVIVLGWYLRFNMATQNPKPTESERKRQEKLITLFKELDEHAKANRKDYDVLVLYSTYGDDNREAIQNIYAECKTKYIDLAEQDAGWGENDVKVSNYWGMFVQTPESKMVTTDDDAPHALASWVWMSKPGTVEAWGVWGLESEAARLKKFVKLTDMPKALKIQNSDMREIAEMMAHWRLGDAEKELEKLEKKAEEGDARNIKVLREFEAYLEEAYRENVAGQYKRNGYLIEYADAMAAFTENYYDKRSTRSGAILDDIKTFKKTDEYKHVEMAKKNFDKLQESINSQLNGGLHGDDYARHHTAIMKRHKSSIDRFNEKYGDTPYAETTRRWAEAADGK